jgi:hypothetical protein
MNHFKYIYFLFPLQKNSKGQISKLFKQKLLFAVILLFAASLFNFNALPIFSGENKLCWFDMEKIFWLHPDLALINPLDNCMISQKSREKKEQTKEKISALASALKKSYLSVEIEKRELQKRILNEKDPAIIKELNDTVNLLNQSYSSQKDEIEKSILHLRSTGISIEETSHPIEFLPLIKKDIILTVNAVIKKINALGAVNTTLFANLISARKASRFQNVSDNINTWSWIMENNPEKLEYQLKNRLNSSSFTYMSLSSQICLPQIMGEHAGRDITDDIIHFLAREYEFEKNNKNKSNNK